MAVTPFKTFVAGEVLTASDLNSSFLQITDNGEDLGWPATKAKDLDGQSLLLDGDADTHITADTDDQIDFAVGGVDRFRMLVESGFGIFRGVSTDAGALAGPTVDLHRDSASPAADDLLGNLVFSGEDSGSNKEEYAEIVTQIATATAGSEDARLLFNMIVGGVKQLLFRIGAGATFLFRDHRGDTSAGPSLLLHRQSPTPANSDILAQISFDGEDSADNQTTYGRIKGAINNVTDAAEKGTLIFEIMSNGSIAEIFRIDAQTQDALLVGKAATDNGATTGVEILTLGRVLGTADGSPPAVWNRLTNDGTIVSFKQAGTEEGTVSISGTTVNYNSFTGAHDAQWAEGHEPFAEPEIGTLLSSTGDPYQRELIETEEGGFAKIDYLERRKPGRPAVPGDRRERVRPGAQSFAAPKPQLVQVKVTDTKADSAIYGVYGGQNEDGEITVWSLGTVQVRVTNTCGPGDLLQSSNVPGVAEVQVDDVVRSHTLGKVIGRKTDAGIGLVAAVLYSG